MEMFVGAKGREERQKLIIFLEDNGFRLDADECRSKEEILDDFLPIIVNVEEKNYRMIGNVTCAAAAVQGGGVKTAEEFYKQFGTICSL